MPYRISPKHLRHFKGFCSSPEIIMLFVYMKCRFSLSYRELEEMAIIRGTKIDHATLQRWLMKFSPLIDQEVRKSKQERIKARRSSTGLRRSWSRSSRSGPNEMRPCSRSRQISSGELGRACSTSHRNLPHGRRHALVSKRSSSSSRASRPRLRNVACRHWCLPAP